MPLAQCTIQILNYIKQLLQQSIFISTAPAQSGKLPPTLIFAGVIIILVALFYASLSQRSEQWTTCINIRLFACYVTSHVSIDDVTESHRHPHSVSTTQIAAVYVVYTLNLGHKPPIRAANENIAPATLRSTELSTQPAEHNHVLVTSDERGSVSISFMPRALVVARSCAACLGRHKCLSDLH